MFLAAVSSRTRRNIFKTNHCLLVPRAHAMENDVTSTVRNESMVQTSSPLDFTLS